MTIPNNLYDDKERCEINLDLLTALDNTLHKNALTDTELDDEKAFLKLRRQRRRLAGTLLISTSLCAVFLLSILAIHEARKTRGMTFAYREELLPVSAAGAEQLRSINTLFANKESGLRAFTPFNSASQILGELRVVTNYTNPCYLAYVVRHPEIEDVVMVTDAFFCSPTTCFYVMDVHNDSFFDEPVTEYRDLTHQLVQVPLPAGSTFIKAENCGHLYLNACNILLRTAEGHHKLAVLVQKTVKVPPTIQFKTAGNSPDFAWMSRLNAEIKAFSTREDQYAIWINWGQLAILTHEQSEHVGEGPIHLTVKASIDGVDRTEVIEMLPVVGNKVLIVLVMKQLEEMKTRVRIHAVIGDHSVIRYHELTLLNKPSAITVFSRDQSFEICELAGQKLKCYSNTVVKPAE